MAKTERYETVIRLNTDQAKREIETLQKKIGDLRKKQSAYAPDSKQFGKLEKEISKNVKQLEMMENRLTTVNKSIRNMSGASPKQLRDTIKDINALLNSGSIERGSENWKALTAALKRSTIFSRMGSLNTSCLPSITAATSRRVSNSPVLRMMPSAPASSTSTQSFSLRRRAHRPTASR